MTKKELYDRALNAWYYPNVKIHKLNRCKAEWREDAMWGFAMLHSYGTLCAVYWRGVVWEFDRWSATTTQHVRKWAKLLDAPVVSLYHTSRMGIREFKRHTACDWADLITAQE